MLKIPHAVIKYNREISTQLRSAFTPLCDALHEKVKSVSQDEILSIINEIAVYSVSYSESKYDIYNEDPPQIIKNTQDNIPLTENEIVYFNNFLSHLNKTATLRPYNIPDLLNGHFSQYLWSPVYFNRKNSNNHAAETCVIPVGEYGLLHTLAMCITSIILVRIADSLVCEGNEIEKNHWDLLKSETASGSRKNKLLQDGMSLESEMISSLDTLKEGIQSFQATLSSLTARKVPKFDSIELVEKIISQGLSQKIAAQIPFSYTLPSIRQGKYFEHIFDLASSTKNSLVFSNAFSEYCKITQKIFQQSRLLDNGRKRSGLLGTGCPLTRSNNHEPSGISVIGNAYLDLYRIVIKSLNDQLVGQKIFSISLSSTKVKVEPQEKPNEFLEYNVDFNEVIKSKQHIGEYIYLHKITEDVLQFWFKSLPVNTLPEIDVRHRWFNSTPEFDKEIERRFSVYIEDIRDQKLQIFQDKNLFEKKSNMQILAIIILLDQFCRNIYRNTPKAYESDKLAQKLALKVINSGEDVLLPLVCRWFLYMPLQHAENLELQEMSVSLFKRLKDDAKEKEHVEVFSNTLKYAIEHKDMIKDIGRFPYRDKPLGRFIDLNRFHIFFKLNYAFLSYVLASEKKSSCYSLISNSTYCEVTSNKLLNCPSIKKFSYDGIAFGVVRGLSGAIGEELQSRNSIYAQTMQITSFLMMYFLYCFFKNTQQESKLNNNAYLYNRIALTLTDVILMIIVDQIAHFLNKKIGSKIQKNEQKYTNNSLVLFFGRNFYAIVYGVMSMLGRPPLLETAAQITLAELAQPLVRHGLKKLRPMFFPAVQQSRDQKKTTLPKIKVY